MLTAWNSQFLNWTSGAFVLQIRPSDLVAVQKEGLYVITAVLTKQEFGFFLQTIRTRLVTCADGGAIHLRCAAYSTQRHIERYPI